MLSDSHKAMAVAQDAEFQNRIRLALVRTALVAITQDNPARFAFAKRILAGSPNLFAAAVAVVTNGTIAAAIAAEGADPDTFGVDDGAIAFTVAEGNDPAVGVFNKLALANVGP